MNKVFALEKDILQDHDNVYFYTPPLQKVRGIMLYPPQKICIRASVNPSVLHRFVSVL